MDLTEAQRHGESEMMEMVLAISSFLASRPSRLRERPTHFLERMDLTEAQRHRGTENQK
jgi:hypothetical protein